ncbi:MAG: hypothetical protein KAS93_02835 [Gammaproteobacteria bacterium]|nr:hypothetical protein [Gammaproteobacteria bacterium]
MSKKQRPVVRRLGASKIDLTRFHDTSSESQRQRLLKLLRKRPVTTVEARHSLNIMAPAPRVFELRHNHGHEIRMEMVRDYTPEGFKHCFARYTLVRENIDHGSGCDEK